ncbi:hypothetical protein HID58_042977 [Brassica napus]|uniref:Uncharacterized protein n=1 Tax=Brassica napus TaxID=3708 RepID=A0ABQ8BF59_BRANA|nr:hypothetical protein HID58_042977 [Brassica napus]
MVKAEKNNPGWSKFGSENPPHAKFPAPTPSMILIIIIINGFQCKHVDYHHEQSFKAKGIAGNIVHPVAKTNAIVAGLIQSNYFEAFFHRISQSSEYLVSYLNHFNPISLCGMTYCLEHPSREILLMPFEPNPYCIYEFVCLFMFPLLLGF